LRNISVDKIRRNKIATKLETKYKNSRELETKNSSIIFEPRSNSEIHGAKKLINTYKLQG